MIVAISRYKKVKLVRDEGGPATGDEAADKMYDFSGKVKDYFKPVHNRNSIDNANMDLILNVHYGEKDQNAYSDGDQMTFGDGDGEIFISFAKSLDVILTSLLMALLNGKQTWNMTVNLGL